MSNKQSKFDSVERVDNTLICRQIECRKSSENAINTAR